MNKVQDSEYQILAMNDEHGNGQDPLSSVPVHHVQSDNTSPPNMEPMDITVMDT